MFTSILASEAPNGYFIPGDVREFWWGAIAFAIVVTVFVRKGVPAISRAMKAKTASVEAELAAAAKAKADAVAELESVKSSLGDADAESARILEAAREQASRLEADLVARAEAEVAEVKARARIEIEASKDQALADLRAEVAAQAAAAADAVVRTNLDEATQSDLIDDYIARVAAS